MINFPGENAEEVTNGENNAPEEEKEMIAADKAETPVEEQAQEVLEEERDSGDTDSDKNTDS